MSKHRYHGLPPQIKGTITVGHEKQHEIVDEIDGLYRLHYEETEKVYLPGSTYDPQFKQYEALEKDGAFVLFTVREYSTLIGYLQYHVYHDMHAQGALGAREDAFYLHPDHRGKGIAPQVLGFAEYFLRKLGCAYAGMTDKSPVGGAPIGGFLEKGGYRKVATYYVKELEK